READRPRRPRPGRECGGGPQRALRTGAPRAGRAGRHHCRGDGHGRRRNAFAGSMSEKKGWFARLKEGLKRTSQSISEGIVGIFTKKPLDQATLDELEELLIAADLGVGPAGRVVETLKRTRFGKEISPEEVREA